MGIDISALPLAISALIISVFNLFWYRNNLANYEYMQQRQKKDELFLRIVEYRLQLDEEIQALQERLYEASIGTDKLVAYKERMEILPLINAKKDLRVNLNHLYNKVREVDLPSAGMLAEIAECLRQLQTTENATAVRVSDQALFNLEEAAEHR